MKNETPLGRKTSYLHIVKCTFLLFLTYCLSYMNFLNNPHLMLINWPIFLQDVKTSMAVQNLVFDAYTNSVAT